MDAAADAAGKPPRAVLMASPGMGHIIPVAELARRLAVNYNLAVTLLTFSGFSKPSTLRSILASLPSASVTTVTLPEATDYGLPVDASIEVRIMAAVTYSMDTVRALIIQLKETDNVVAFVADLFWYPALQLAADMSIPGFIFFPSNLQLLSFLIHLPEIDKNTIGAFRDLPEPIRIPGCVPIPGADLCDPAHDREGASYAIMLDMPKAYAGADGVLVNSYFEIEPWTVKALADGEWQPKVHAIGPIVRPAAAEEKDESGCLAWLDRQPEKSVLLVSFGSGGTLSTAQTAELALGLEKCGQRFLWVVHRPSVGAAGSVFFGDGTEARGNSPASFLPEGFIERTAGVGLVVASWMPQVAVINHPAVVGFVTHCGWNSTMESLSAGVPMVAWPLYAEQRMNAVLLAEGAKVALRMKPAADGSGYDRDEIAAAAKKVIEGAAMRQRAEELQDAAARALLAEGSSTKALAAVVEGWLAGRRE